MLPCPLQVLTRRDQLKFKEEKQKNENPEDACDDTKEEDGEEPEPAQKKRFVPTQRRQRGKARQMERRRPRIRQRPKQR